MNAPITTKAIVTGHSRGLGEAITADLLGRGMAVLGLARATHEGLAQRYPGQLQQAALEIGRAHV